MSWIIFSRPTQTLFRIFQTSFQFKCSQDMSPQLGMLSVSLKKKKCGTNPKNGIVWGFPVDFPKKSINKWSSPLGFVKNTMLWCSSKWGPLGPVYPGKLEWCSWWVPTMVRYWDGVCRWFLALFSSLRIQFDACPLLSRLGCFLDFRFCPLSKLLPAIWSWKLPFQRYLPHFHFPWYLQQFGAQTVHLTW